MNYRIIAMTQSEICDTRLSSHESHPVGSGTLRNGGPMNYRIITIAWSEICDYTVGIRGCLVAVCMVT
jgi:hypothetical protein